MKHFAIAIDGPSGAGKSTLARAVAKQLGYVYVDTGALYRSIGLFVLRKGIDKNDSVGVIGELDGISLQICYENDCQHVYLNEEDVTDKIRTPEISLYASAVSAIPEVRAFLLETQRTIAKENSVVMDGRDIATVILPHADVKIFLTASDKVRAERRYKELLEKDPSVTFEQVLEDMALRDKNDSTRKVAPAVKAADAVLLDNSELDFQGTVDAVLNIVKDTIGVSCIG